MYDTRVYTNEDEVMLKIFICDTNVESANVLLCNFDHVFYLSFNFSNYRVILSKAFYTMLSQGYGYVKLIRRICAIQLKGRHS